MKRRNGFVSNSSSTSFFFVFGSKDINHIKNVLNKYKDRFNLSYHMVDEEISCTGDEVIYEILRNINNINNIGNFNIDVIIENINKDLERLKSIISDNMHDRYWMGITFNKTLYLLNGLKDAKNNGLEYTYVVPFGNEEGDDNVNALMDLKSESLNMREDDLYILVENNH